MPRSLPLLLFLIFFRITAYGALPHKTTSVLADGLWFKIAVTQTGIHQVTYQDLLALGIDPQSVEVEKIRIFGNGAGMLPEANNAPRIDDLREIAIKVMDGGDNRFDAADLILFYGESADRWSYDKMSRYFSHQRNLYSDTTYYYLNINTQPGKRVRIMESSTATPTDTSTHTESYWLNELDSLSLLRSGREWYGEVFDKTTDSHTFPLLIPDIDSTVPVRVKTFVVAKSPYSSYFFLIKNNQKIDSLKVDSSEPAAFTLMGRSKFKVTYLHNPGPDQTITLRYNMPTQNSIGWLNYLQISYSRKLNWIGPQMGFRDSRTYGPGKITLFSLSNANPDITVWEVTDPSSIGEFETSISGNTLTFKRAADSLREFFAYDGSYFHPVILRGAVPNQNLHASQPADLVIVTHPLFLAQAQELARFHEEDNSLSVQVATTSQVFNEFSCGQPDPTSIRDFMKLLYDRSGGKKPRYLLLFGDGSYDPKNRIPGNNNFIPTFQSIESLTATSSYVTDDYFGLMDDNAGQEANGKIYIGIGRFPVSTVGEAQAMVNKIRHYSSEEPPVRGSWRNVLTFVADDENNNLHLRQAEEICAIVAEKYPLFNVDKIFFDAYQMIQIPGGQRFPDATAALNNAVAKGSLIINYTGHGGETGWGYEQVLNTSDIESWSNKDMMPVFVTATCEFSRFDNPERFTAGEMTILHPNGGAIALYSTTRLAYAGQNIKLDTSFFHNLMDRDENGEYIKMGDLIRISKNNNKNNEYLRNFVLLGDPAQNIAFPEYNVRTTEINGEAVNQPVPAPGMSTVVVKGYIEDQNAQKVTNMQGALNCKLFDKPVTYKTLGNRPGDSYPQNFVIQNSLLFNGDVPVTNGEFQVTMVIPKSISLQYGAGKLSYYANGSGHDAAGYSHSINIGGASDIDPHNQGPDIGLYLDNREFRNGGVTSSSPLLIADLYDSNGINFIGLGIGHEIEMVLDHDRAHAIILNDHYKPAFNMFTRGTAEFAMSGLLPGLHTLSVRAWDMFDNSNTREISFMVSGSQELSVKKVMNIPNPMFDHTAFVFQPDPPVDGPLEVQIQIYNLTGRLVHTIKATYQMPLDTLPALSWDGTDDAGNKLSSGIYPYKILFRTDAGEVTQTSQKLVIIR